MSLFRHEVYENQRFRLHGDVTLTGTTSNWVLVGLLVGIVVAAGAWVGMGHYARTETAIGYIVPDGTLTRILPTRAGVVTRLGVKEGDLVKAGQPLATVLVAQSSSDRADPAGAELGSIDRQHTLVGKQIGLSRQSQVDEAAKLFATVTQTRSELRALGEQIIHQTRLVQSARDSFEPLSDAANEGYVSKIEFEARRQQFLSAQVQLAQLQAQEAQLRGQLQQAEAGLSELPAQTASKINDLMASQAELIEKRIDVENARSYVITAPVTGRVSALQANAGTTVTSQTPLMSIVAEGSRMQAEVYAPTRAIGFARVGQDVRLLYDAFPYQRFGSFPGRIISISKTVLAPNEIDAPLQSQTKEPMYRIEVAIASQSILAFGERVPLQPGMTLQANIVLDRRSFLDWLLTPINAIRNRT